MASILRKSIKDISAFERKIKQKRNGPKAKTKNASSSDEAYIKLNHWSGDASSANSPPLDALYNLFQCRESKRVCFNFEKLGYLIDDCPEPLNLSRIALNLEKFKKEKAERSNNRRWSKKRINFTELQPSQSNWEDVYKTIITEALLEQFNDKHFDSTPSQLVSLTDDFKNFTYHNEDGLPHSFKISVGDGDLDMAKSTFTSLFNITVNRPNINTNRQDSF